MRAEMRRRRDRTGFRREYRLRTG